MVCKPEAVKDITTVLGVTPTSVTTPTWKDHVYSCDYVYAGGARMTLHVKELETPTDTTAYFNDQGRRSARSRTCKDSARAPHKPSTGIVVRKDYKVLTIDMSSLPAEFGVPPDTARTCRSTSPRPSWVAGRASSASVEQAREPAEATAAASANTPQTTNAIVSADASFQPRAAPAATTAPDAPVPSATPS